MFLSNSPQFYLINSLCASIVFVRSVLGFMALTRVVTQSSTLPELTLVGGDAVEQLCRVYIFQG